MADRIREQATFGALPDGFDDVLSGQPAAAFRGARSALRDYEAAVDAIVRNDELSAKGRTAARQRAARQAFEALGQIEVGPLAVSRRKVDKIASTLRPREPDPETRIARALEAAELRRYVLERWQDPLERSVVLRDAAEAGDEALVHAMLDAPRVMKMVEPDVAAEVRQKMVERSDPLTARELRQALEATDFADQALAAARRAVQKDLGSAPDAIEMQAKGGTDG